jgi:hypothetical protein
MMAGAIFAVRVVGVVGILMALLMCLLFGGMLETAAAVGNVISHILGVRSAGGYSVDERRQDRDRGRKGRIKDREREGPSIVPHRMGQ